MIKLKWTQARVIVFSMIVNLPTWLQGKVSKAVCPTHTISRFTLPVVNRQKGDRAAYASKFKLQSLFKFPSFSPYSYHLHCAISGPG